MFGWRGAYGNAHAQKGDYYPELFLFVEFDVGKAAYRAGVTLPLSV